MVFKRILHLQHDPTVGEADTTALHKYFNTLMDGVQRVGVTATGCHVAAAK